MVCPHLDVNCKSHTLPQIQTTYSMDAMCSNGAIDISNSKEFELVHSIFLRDRACSIYIFTHDNLTHVVVKLMEGRGPEVNNTKCDLARTQF